jgi:hypothetical protein
MKINIQIAELVLEGFDYHDHKRISNAMKIELTRLVAEKGLGQTSVEQEHGVAHISAPAFQMPTDRNPRMIGNEIARSVFKGLKR